MQKFTCYGAVRARTRYVCTSVDTEMDDLWERAWGVFLDATRDLALTGPDTRAVLWDAYAKCRWIGSLRVQRLASLPWQPPLHVSSA